VATLILFYFGQKSGYSYYQKYTFFFEKFTLKKKKNSQLSMLAMEKEWVASCDVFHTTFERGKNISKAFIVILELLDNA